MEHGKNFINPDQGFLVIRLWEESENFGLHSKDQYIDITSTRTHPSINSEMITKTHFVCDAHFLSAEHYQQMWLPVQILWMQMNHIHRANEGLESLLSLLTCHSSPIPTTTSPSLLSLLRKDWERQRLASVSLNVESVRVNVKSS